MGRSIEDLIEFIHNGEDVFIKIHKPSHEDEALPYGKVSEYIRSHKFRDVDYSAVKMAYKQGGRDPVRIAKRPIGFGYTSRFIIEISDDKMSCYLTLLPPRDREQMTDPSIIVGELKKKGIILGINESEISKAIDNKIFKTKIIIASGKCPVPGNDARLKHIVPCYPNLSHLKSKYSTLELLEKFELLKPVKPGDVTALLEPATAGTPGITMFGNNVSTVKGEPLEIVASNMELKENKLIAKTNGHVILTKTGLEIEPIFLVNNIEKQRKIRYDGSIKIMCDVESRLIVEATGDIEIHGVVSDTTLYAGRNIFIHGNLISSYSESIIAGDDFFARNVSNANITAENILVMSTILNSELTAYSSVSTLDKDGKISGGHTRAGLSVKCGTIGNETGVNTRISVATPEIIAKFKTQILSPYTRAIDDNKNYKTKILKKIEHVENMQKQPGEKEPAIYNKLVCLFKLKLEQYEHKISRLYKEIVKIKDPKFTLITGDITADRFYPNTFLAMGISKRKINDLKEKVRYYVKDSNIFTELLDKD